MSILPKKLQSRLLLSYALPLGFLVIFAGTIGLNIRNQQKIAEELVRVNIVVDGVRDSMLGLSREIRSVRGQALFPGEEEYLTSYNTGTQEFTDAVAKVEGEIRDEQQKANWAKFITAVEAIRADGEKAMDLIEQGKVKDALPIVDGMKMSAIQELYDTILERQKDIIAEIDAKSARATSMAMTTTIAGLILGIIGTLVLGTFIAAAIANQVKAAANAISSSSAEIATTMLEQEATANQQAASVNETTTTMDELGASARQSEEQADSAAVAAQEVLQLAENGNRSVEDTVNSMIDMKNKVGAIAEQTMRLSEQTTQIGNISQLVSDLAQQTNMLALNASVEAVRAGEHGKGFAVVAEEIRKLADQSKQSAEKIGNLVTDIQNAINTTVMVTDEGTKTVNAGMQVTESSAQAFAGVVEAINNVVMNNQQITLNIRQQGRAFQQVLAAMEQINQGAQQTAASLGQVQTGTKQLNDTAKELQTIV